MDIFTLLFLAICILAALQPTEERFRAAFVFAFLIVVHDLSFADADGWLYFPSAAIFDALAAYLLCAMPGTLARWLVVMALASFVGNATGFLLWVTYMPSDFYESFFKAVYAFSILLLVGGEPHAWRHFRGFDIPWAWASGRAACRRSMGILGKAKNCETH